MRASSRHARHHPVCLSGAGGVFDHYETDARIRQRRARKDSYRLFRRRNRKRNAAWSRLSDNTKRSWARSIRQRVAVDRRAAKGRHVGIGHDLRTKPPPEGLRERHPDGRQLGGLPVDQRPKLFHAQHGAEADFQIGTSALRRCRKSSSILIASVRRSAWTRIKTEGSPTGTKP